jgi:hypothetical protein
MKSVLPYQGFIQKKETFGGEVGVAISRTLSPLNEEVGVK